MLSIINAMSNAIHNEYPDNDIYIEDIEQNFTPGTFFIDILASTDDKKLDYRRYRSYSYDVMYYPVSDTEPKAEIVAMGESLRSILETMPYGDAFIRSEERSTRIVDDVLHMEVTFNVFVEDPIDEPVMERMTTSINTE